MEGKSLEDTRNFQENENRRDDIRYCIIKHRNSLDEKALDMDSLREAVKHGHERYTRRFFIHATLYLSFIHPVKEIDDFYKLLKNQVQDYGNIWYPEWKPLILYILSKLMCDLHQVRGHNEMKKFRASMRREILVDMRYKTTIPNFIYNYQSDLPTDDDGHFQYASIFFDESPCDKEEVEYQGLEFETVSVLNRLISYKQHLKKFELSDANYYGYGYPMPLCDEFLKDKEESEE